MAAALETTTEPTTSTDPSTSEPSADLELNQIKREYGDKCLIISDIGIFRNIVKVQLPYSDVAVKFKVFRNYPQTPPEGVLTRLYFDDPLLDEELLSVMTSQTTITAMVHVTRDWLEQHKHLLAKKSKLIRKKDVKKPRKRPQEETMDKKKPPMKTATDVISRIQWDSNLEADLFTVGYVDRFLGVVEKNFSILSWEDPAAVDDYEALAIPKHRIEYFKYKEFKVWDKKSRTDYVFGSSGEKKLTILDVIEKYDQFVEPKAKPDEQNEYESDSDDDDDDIKITMNTTTTQQIVDQDSDSDDYVSSYWRDKLRPNYFICLRIHDEEIKSMVDLVQDTLISRQPLYDSCCIKLTALHITLCTVRLNSAEQVQDVVRALQEFTGDFTKLKTKVHLEGTDTFGTRVLYAKVHYDENLLKLVDSIQLALRSSGIELLDGQDFVPHMTIMKTSRPVSRQIGKAIPKSVYADSESVVFGDQIVDNINLCEMGAPSASDGFYVSPLKLQL